MTEASSATVSCGARTQAACAVAPAKRRLVLVTGMSGAGHSTALKALEDLGYEAVDNLPLSLVGVLTQPQDGEPRPLALGIDSRTRDFSAEAFIASLEELRRRPDLHVELLFMECSDEVLQRRFTETRRRHPLAIDRPVPDGIQRERVLLAPLKAHADLIVDSTELSINDARRMLASHFKLGSEPGLFVFVVSFAFRNGVPREADLVFDVRFLRNPHYDPALRPLTGQDPAVADHVAADPDFPGFMERLGELLRPLLPRYNQEGKSYLTIAVGCTGGKHRSVFVAERLAAWLRAQGYRVGLTHRDMPAGEAVPGAAAGGRAGAG